MFQILNSKSNLEIHFAENSENMQVTERFSLYIFLNIMRKIEILHNLLNVFFNTSGWITWFTFHYCYSEHIYPPYEHWLFIPVITGKPAAAAAHNEVYIHAWVSTDLGNKIQCV